MADEGKQPERQLALQKLYVKDVSFETPNSPNVFTLKWEPAVEFNLNTHATTLQEDLYEITLSNKGGLVMPVIIEWTFKDGSICRASASLQPDSRPCQTCRTSAHKAPRWVARADCT